MAQGTSVRSVKLLEETLPRLRSISEDALSELCSGNPDLALIAKAGPDLARLRNLYEKAIQEQDIDMFFRDRPRFEHLAGYFNYFLASNPNSKANARAYLEEGDLQKAAVFLEQYIETTTREPTESNAELRKNLPNLEVVMNFMLGDWYAKWADMIQGKVQDKPGELKRSQLKKTKGGILLPDGADVPEDKKEEKPKGNLDILVKIAESYVRGALYLAGGDEEVEKDLGNLLEVRKRDRIEEELSQYIRDEKFGDAAETMVNYIRAAFYAYGNDLPGSDEIVEMADQMQKYFDSMIKIVEEAGEARETLDTRSENLRKRAKTAKRKDKHAKAAKQVERAEKRKEEAIAGLGRKIMDVKHKVDGYVNEDAYRKKLHGLVDYVMERFGHEKYAASLAAREAEITETLRAEGFEKKAGMLVEALRKTWPYFTRSYDKKELDPQFINYGYLAVLAEKDKNLEILRKRIESLERNPLQKKTMLYKGHNGNFGVPCITDEAEFGPEAQRIIEMMVPEERRTPLMDSRNLQLLKVLEARLSRANDVPYQREMAYVAAEKNMKTFRKVAKDVEKSLRAPWVNDRNREQTRKEALQRALIERVGFFENGDNPAAQPFESYKLLFPYAAAFFPAERISLNGAPDIAASLGADPKAIREGKSEGYQNRESWFEKVGQWLGEN